MKPHLRVVAAALFDDAGRVLIAQRPEGKHMAGWWEFPGGKVATAKVIPRLLCANCAKSSESKRGPTPRS